MCRQCIVAMQAHQSVSTVRAFVEEIVRLLESGSGATADSASNEPAERNESAQEPSLDISGPFSQPSQEEIKTLLETLER